MKKRIGKIVLMLTLAGSLICGGIGGSAIEAEAAKNSKPKLTKEEKKLIKETKAAYLQFIENEDALEEYQGRTLSIVNNISFGLQDFNQDNIPELILSATSGKNYVVYTYRDGMVMNYDSHDNVDSNVELRYTKKQNTLVHKFQDDNETLFTYSVQKCDEKIMTQKLLMMKIVNEKNETTTYKINGAEVSKKVFQQYLTKYYKDGTKVKTYKNNAKNRKKLLSA